MTEDIKKIEEHNVLHESGKFIKTNNVTFKCFNVCASWCSVEEGVMSCKLGILTGC